MARVKIIALGGTIASKWDPSLGGAVPTATVDELVKSVPQIEEFAELKAEQFSNVASHFLTPKNFLELSKRCHEVFRQEQPDGIVITMGTATLAECAYTLDLLLREERPIVVTGAMRNLSLVSADGPRNLLDSVIAASSNDTKGLGVLACLNGELHLAREVIKTHTESVETFKSWDFGPVGVVRTGKAIVYRHPTIVDQMSADLFSARVEVVMAMEGDDGRLLEAAADIADGIVLVGIGAGVVPPTMIPSIQRAIQAGKVVVMVTRCIGGPVLQGVYAIEGAEAHLTKIGVLLGGNLSPSKARIKLMLALSNKLDSNKLRTAFHNL